MSSFGRSGQNPSHMQTEPTKSDRPKVTDAGLVKLKGLTNLQELDLLDLEPTNVIDAWMKDLQRALPNYTIHH
jgi:hypothetical protein